MAGPPMRSERANPTTKFVSLFCYCYQIDYPILRPPPHNCFPPISLALLIPDNDQHPWTQSPGATSLGLSQKCATTEEILSAPTRRLWHGTLSSMSKLKSYRQRNEQILDFTIVFAFVLVLVRLFALVCDCDWWRCQIER